MKRFIIFLILLILGAGAYNFTPLRGSFMGFFGDLSYKKTDFLSAQARYSDILKNHSGATLLEADILYNLGNTLYRLGEKETNIQQKISLWEKSLGSYTKSLSIRLDKETEENLAFVKSKLEQEEQKEKKKKEEEKKQEEKSGSGQQNNTSSGAENTGNKTGSGQSLETGGGTEQKEMTTGSGSEEGAPKPGKSWSNGGAYNPIGGQNQEQDTVTLSDADKQEVKKYLEQLKQFEKENGKLLNPEKPGEMGSISDQIRNFFGNDSFFQDVLPTNDGKKDW